MAYGTPAALDDVEAYYTHIRGGRKPSPDQLSDLVSRYRAIGGNSPLLKITHRQAAKLQSALAEKGSEVKVYAGMKHSPPFLSEVVRNASEDGVTEFLCVALAPHYSTMSIGGYMRSVEEANARLGGKLKINFVRSWHDRPDFVSLWVDRIGRAKRRTRNRVSLVFSAHSLPERILQLGDPYKQQLMESSNLIADKLDWKDWTFTFQSASQNGEKWLGPDILEHLKSLYDRGRRTFLIAPIGFVSDHLEILYDIDIECLEWAKQHDSQLLRCESLNDSDDFISCLASLVAESGFV